MSLVQRNIVSNFVGKFIAGVLGFIFVPLYIRYLGVEAFGLVGFFISLQAIIVVLDMGLNATTSREVARRIGQMRNDDFTSLLYSLELLYYAMAIALICLFFLLGDWLAEEWIKSDGISPETLRFCILIFGFSIALRWPCGFYSGVLIGAERQVVFNSLYTLFSLLKSVGSALVVVAISSTIEAFVGWQAVVALVELIVMRLVYRKLVPNFHGKTPTRFRIDLIKQVWRFSAGVGLNTILAIGIKQLDRLLISGMLPIAFLGYYTSAHLLYSGIAMISGPFCTAAFPRFANLYAQNKGYDLARLYHSFSQTISFLVAPVASILFFFPYEILSLWTQSESIAQNASVTLSYLSIAGLLNSIMQLPWKLQLSAGVTWIAILNNSVNFCLFTPVAYFLIDRYGLNGAGLSWLIFNVVYFMAVPHLMHRKILKGHKIQWIFKDNLSFCAISFSIFGCVFMLFQHTDSFSFKLSGILIGCVAYVLIVLTFFTEIRASIMVFIFTGRNRP